MAETENITILRVGTEEAVRNIQDLKDNIVQLKKDLQGLDIGSEEYSKTLKELNVNQNALRDAMHYTNTEGQTSEQVMNGIANAASGAGNSYNALVAQMKSLREQWRATDDVARRNELGKQILDINNQLKGLDESTGSFKRNVGNYASALDGLEKGFKATAGSAGSVVEPVKNAKGAFQALSKTSAIAIFGIIAGAVARLVSKLKENEAVTNAVKKAMDSLKPITDIISGVFDKLAGYVAKVIDKFGELAGDSASTFSKIVSGAVGVGNALLQYLLTPIRTTISAFKSLGNVIKDVFTGQFGKIKDDATKAFSEIQEAFQKGFDFKGNFDLGKKVGQNFLDGLATGAKDKKKQESVVKEVVDLVDQIQKAVENKLKGEGLGSNILSLQRRAIESEIKKLKAAGKTEEQIVEEISSRLFGIRKKWSDRQARQIENDAATAARESELKDIERFIVEDSEALAAEIDAIWDAQVESYFRAKDEAARQVEAERQGLENRMNAAAEGSYEYLKAQIELRKFEYDTLAQLDNESNEKFYARKLAADKAYTDAKRALLDKQVQDMQWASSTTSSILGSIADIYESVNSEDEKAAQQTKALRIAGAIIDTISGAVAAFTSAQSIPPPAGQIIGAANAAAVTAAGIAQIAKIRSTNVSRTSTANTSLSGFSTPTVSTSVPQTTIVRGAQDQTLLNQLAQPSRVYILQSDIEAAAKASKARVADTTFE